MIYRRLLLLFVLIFLFKPIFGQDNDFGIWYGAEAEVSASKNIKVDLSSVLRTFNNASKIDQGYFEAGATYKFNKFISAAGSYRLINKLEKDTKYHLRHRFMADVKGSYSISDISFSARIRFQAQKQSYIEDESDRPPEYHARIKLKGIYKTRGFPLNPYLAIETYAPVFENYDHLIDKTRFSAGLNYKISKMHSVEVEYTLQRDYTPHLKNLNVVAVSYLLNF